MPPSPARQRKGPANLFKVGHIAKSQDGQSWIIKQITNKNGQTYHRWVRITTPTVIKSKSPHPRKSPRPSPKKEMIKSKSPRPSPKKRYIKNGSKVSIHFTPTFMSHPPKMVSEDIQYDQLPAQVQKEVIQYFESKEFLNLFLTYISYNDHVKTKVIKIDWLAVEVLIIHIECVLYGNHIDL